jgi:hypothetical protein
MAERRTASRSRSFLRGRVFFNNRLSSIDCIIRDITDQGARLTFGGAVNVPEIFELEIPNKDETFRARVAWHRGAEIGVTFDIGKPAGAETSDSPLTERIERLEKEIAAIKRRLEELRPRD